MARLDARAAAAPDAVRAGLLARMAFAEAAGWLAHAHAWVHPLDLALRAAGLTASTALAAVGRGHRALPQTFAGPFEPPDWATPPFDRLAEGDRVLSEALTLARVLARLPGGGSDPAGFAGAAEAAVTLQGLAAGALDVDRLAAWWATHAPPAPQRRRFGAGEGGPPPLPPLLALARAAASWMEDALTAPPAPALSLLAATARCGVGGAATRAAVHTVFVPIWAAYPAVGFGDPTALPTLRSDAADRLLGRHRPITWPLACLHLIAESARMGLRELDRLAAAAAQGRGLTTLLDQRSRLPDVIEALLRAPVLTPKALAAKLAVAPQTATALLRRLQGEALVREVTGRGSFRAFAM